MDKQTFWNNCKRPKGWFLALIYIVTVASIVGALCILFVDYVGTPLEYVAYGLFALAACTLAYSVYTIVIYFPIMKNKIMGTIRSYPFLAKLLDNFSFRTLVFAFGSLLITVAYSVYNGVIAIILSSVWYGSLAFYYILLVFLRGGISLYHGKRRGLQSPAEADEITNEITEIKKYRTCGILLIVTILALSVAITQMVAQNEGFQYYSLFIYVAAAYAFTKITFAIYNAFKAKKERSGYTILALRNISLADAAVSILSLQTAMFHAFSEPSVSTRFANALTGGAVCAFVVFLGVMMIIKANRTLRQAQNNPQ